MDSPAVVSSFTSTFNRNLFAKAFETASNQPPRIIVSPLTETHNHTESLNTPSILISSNSPTKTPKNLFPLPSIQLSTQTSNLSRLTTSPTKSTDDQNDTQIQVKRSRGRPRKELPAICNDETTDRDKKRLELKAKNRLAALRHRESRKKWTREIAHRVRTLETQNAILEAQLETYKKKVRTLEDEISSLTKSPGLKLFYKVVPVTNGSSSCEESSQEQNSTINK